MPNDRVELIGLVAQSMDGYIARTDGELVDWSSREDKRLFVEETKRAGVVIVGSNTYRTFPPNIRPLKDRLNIVLSSDSTKFEQHPSLEVYTGDLSTLAKNLQKRGYERGIVAGGMSVYSQFLEAGLLDELWVTIEPIWLNSGLPIFRNPRYDLVDSLISSRTLNDKTVHLRYKLKYGNI